MAKAKRKGGRTTPKGTRPAHLRPVRDEDDAAPVDELIDTAARELLDADDPIATETWASGMLDAFDGARVQARLADLEVPPFEEAVLQRCRQRPDRRALVVAAGLAAVVPPPSTRSHAPSWTRAGRWPVRRRGWPRSGGRRRREDGLCRTCSATRSR